MDKSAESPSVAASPRSRRKLRNLLLQPKVQLQLPGLILLITFVYGLGFIIAGYLAMDNLYQTVLAPLDLIDAIKQSINERMFSLANLLASSALLYGLVTVAICVMYTHRLVGPSVAFRRQIQALKSGDYSARVKLRNGDAFTDVADELNELSEALEKQQGASKPECENSKHLNS